MQTISYRIAVSPNGWTDQELGYKWMKKNFEPETRRFLINPDEYRLLILDGHNSHCTHDFCSFARDHNIIIICLPSHTTHVLQPCDVLIFSPLQIAWRKAVKAAGKVTKHTVAAVYSTARNVALKSETIVNSFRVTGIHPVDRHIIPEHKFEPATNTTTISDPLLNPPELAHDSIVHVDPPSILPPELELQNAAGPNHRHQAVQTPTTMFLGAPPQIPHTASKEMFISQNDELRLITEALMSEIQTQRLRLHFAKIENDKLRQVAFGRPKPKQALDTSGARELTAEEHLKALQEHEQQPIIREQAKVDRQREREHQREEQVARKEREKEQKAIDKLLGLAMTGFRAAEVRLGPKHTRRRRPVADPGE